MSTVEGGSPAVLPTDGRRPPTADPPRRRRLGAAVLVVVLVAGLSIPVVYYGLLAPSAPSNNIPIQHIVIVLMENHAFDSLFGDYCPAVTPVCPTAVAGVPPHTCVPYDPNDTAAGCVEPYNFSEAMMAPPDMPHEWNATVDSLDGGAMNGFYDAEGGTIEPFGHYNGSLVPVYWDLAEEYGLGDDFFSSALSYSLPNHWYLLAGQAPPNALNTTDLSTVQGRHAYLNQSNATKTVEDELNDSPNVSWGYFDWALPTYQQAINGAVGVNPVSAYNYWNPLAAKYESYTRWYVDHFLPRSDFFGLAANGTLPDISWIIPDQTFSDHPPANLSAGQAFVAQVVDSVEESPEWSSTAIFLSWDDYGGFYDNVAPPRIDPLGLSLRVPLIVISPYTPAGLVSPSLDYFESLLHFVEWRFDLGCITKRDCNAPLPLQYFDFHMTPRNPILVPTNWSYASYPFVTSSNALDSVAHAGSATFSIDPSRWNTGPPAPGTPEDDID